MSDSMSHAYDQIKFERWLENATLKEIRAWVKFHQDYENSFYGELARARAEIEKRKARNQ